MRDSPSFLTFEFGKKAWLLQSDANVRDTDQKSIRGLSPSLLGSSEKKEAYLTGALDENSPEIF